MIKIITHNGSFHSDDVFAVATLQMHLGIENTEVIRTRDAEIINTGDWVLDVGGEYNRETRRFDHHQVGAPVRESGLPYSSFGLLWREIGVDITESEEIAKILDQKLVQPVDAGDNGVQLYKLNERNIAPFELYQIIDSFHPDQGGHETTDEAFIEAVEFATKLLQRLIAQEKAKETLRAEAEQVYQQHPIGTKVIVADHPISVSYFSRYPEVEVVVKPRTSEPDSDWIAKVVPTNEHTFENRALFPREWAGMRDNELATVSEIDGAIFCHTARFIFIAKTKESAIRAANQAQRVE